jgi:hypothetical protein
MKEWMYRSTFSLCWYQLEMSGLFDNLAPLPHKERAPNTHWIGGCIGLKISGDEVESITFLALLGLELWSFCRPAHSQSLY